MDIKKWQKSNGEVRHYINDWLKICDGHADHYNTGNVSSASIFGGSISNSEYKRNLSSAKVWYDKDRIVHVDYAGDDYKDRIKGRIESVLQTLDDTETNMSQNVKKCEGLPESIAALSSCASKVDALQAEIALIEADLKKIIDDAYLQHLTYPTIQSACYHLKKTSTTVSRLIGELESHSKIKEEG